MEDTYTEDDKEPQPPKSAAWYLVARDCGEDELLLLNKQEVFRKACIHQDKGHETSDDEPPVSSLSDNTRPQPYPKSITQDRQKEDVEACKVPMTAKAKIVTQWDENPYMTKWWPLLCIFGSSFGAFHLIPWNSEFPTAVELDLWRVSAVASVVTSVLCMQFRAISLSWDGPLTIVRVGSPIVYMICRIIMVAQSFAALRAMPEAAYQMLEIWNYWLHLF